jgi:hypothetical protein
MAAAMTTTASISREGMLIARIVTRGTYVTLSIPRLVAMEVVERCLPATRQRPVITVMRVVAVIDMPEEPMRAVEPGASSNKQAADKPVRPVIAVRSAIVWSIVEVSVGAYGGWPYVYANRNLRRTRLRTHQHGRGENRECKNLTM